MDEVSRYSRALSATEVMVRYLALSPGLVGRWKLDEGAPSAVAGDTSGQGNHACPERTRRGTLQSGPAWASGKYGSGPNGGG